MKYIICIVIIIFSVGCSSKDQHKINYKTCNESSFNLLKNSRDSGNSIFIIDKYVFESGISRRRTVQFLFKIENHNDTFILFEYRNPLTSECPEAQVDTISSVSDPWDFQKLDTKKINSLHFALVEKGRIDYSKYNKFNSVQGEFGCHEE